MNVLIATDGSASAGHAKDLVAGIQWPADTTFHLVTVVEPLEPIIGGAWVAAAAYNGDRIVAAAEAEAKEVVEEAAKQLADAGLVVESRVLRGRPASRIVERAREVEADLVVVGSRGRGSITSMILGSVSGEVADHAPCPVLIARSGSLTRVVLGHDGSDFARHAEEVVATLPIFRGVPVTVVSVARMTRPWTAGLGPSNYEPPEEYFAQTTAALIGEYRSVAEAAEQRLREAGLRATGRVVEGDPATELIRVAADQDADLIVVGTHGRTGLNRLVVGSVARNVMMHAACSVLVIRKAS